MWLQQEVLKGTVEVRKVPGQSNPADLMTKYLHVETIRSHLILMNMIATLGNEVKKVTAKGGNSLMHSETSGKPRLIVASWADEAAEDCDIEEVSRWWSGS